MDIVDSIVTAGAAASEAAAYIEAHLDKSSLEGVYEADRREPIHV
jgi:hypothetical protein